MTIKLLVFDIDGVLTDGEAQPLDLGLLAQLRRLNRDAQTEGARTAVTICSGRPAPYVELLLQAIDGHLPAVYENGAGLYLPANYRFLPHPELEGRLPTMRDVRHRLQRQLVQPGFAYFQPGKEFSMTLFATNPGDTRQLMSRAAAALGPLRDSVDLVYSVTCLNILARDIHKGKGIEFLADRCGIDRCNMLGVGDSDVDLQFLATVGYSAAPANAGANVKSIVQYVSPYAGADGVRDILRHLDIS